MATIFNNLGRLQYSVVKALESVRNATDLVAHRPTSDSYQILGNAEGFLSGVHRQAGDLNAAIADMVAFWRARHREIVFDVRLLEDESLVDEARKETIYRVVQESVNNALRHGGPSRIEVAVSFGTEGGVIVRVSDNGTAKAEMDAPRSDQSGFGLIGMRERVAASGGTLSIDRDNPAGWTVIARLPAGAIQQEAAE